MQATLHNMSHPNVPGLKSPDPSLKSQTTLVKHLYIYIYNYIII